MARRCVQADDVNAQIQHGNDGTKDDKTVAGCKATHLVPDKRCAYKECKGTRA